MNDKTIDLIDLEVSFKLGVAPNTFADYPEGVEESDSSTYSFDKLPNHKELVESFLNGTALTYEDYENEKFDLSIWVEQQDNCPNGINL